MKRTIVCISITLLLVSIFTSPTIAGGNDIKISPSMVQKQFDDLSKELGLIISYVPLSPAEPLGITGFDLGIELTAADISSDSDFWKNSISDQKPPDYIILPKVHLQKGLPFGFDVGVIFATAPGTNVSLYGGELKWALMKGGILSPAVALRGSYTALAGVDDLDASTYGLDASVSKGFGPLTPYAGVGEVWIKTSEKVAAIQLNDVDTSATKLFIGTKIKLLLLSVVLQADFSEIQMYSARANISF